MTDPLTAAREAAARAHRAEAKLTAARGDLHAAVAAALAAGYRQADVARATGYTRERVRQLAARA